MVHGSQIQVLVPVVKQNSGLAGWPRCPNNFGDWSILKVFTRIIKHSRPTITHIRGIHNEFPCSHSYKILKINLQNTICTTSPMTFNPKFLQVVYFFC